MHVLVDDPDVALSFYRDTLGLTVQNEVASGGFRWITLVTDSQPDIGSVSSQPHAGRSQEDGDALAALLAKGELGSVHLRSDDLDATFAKIPTAPGVEVLEEPASRPWAPVTPPCAIPQATWSASSRDRSDPLVAHLAYVRIHGTGRSPEDGVAFDPVVAPRPKDTPAASAPVRRGGGRARIFLSPDATGDYCGGAASARLRKRLAASL